jgi:hypothetical protein
MTTVLFAKNVMKRAVDEIVDPPPKKRERALIWEYFESRCAYCDKPLNRNARGDGHLDHANPNGGNHLGNRVLACNTCNGDHKRDKSWLAFLRGLGLPTAEYEKRVDRIREWRRLHPKLRRLSLSTAAENKRAELERLRQDFGKRCNELKTLIRESRS